MLLVVGSEEGTDDEKQRQGQSMLVRKIDSDKSRSAAILLDQAS